MTNSTVDNVIAAEINVPLDVTLARSDERWTLVIRRQFRQAPERIWEMLTEPDQLARWSPVVPDRPLTLPGPATCRENPGDEPINATVITADAPRLLVHHWGTDLLKWTITPSDDGSILELRQTFDDHSIASSYAGGWQICLGTLAANADASTHERVTGQRAIDYGWEQLRDFYHAEMEKMSAGE